MEAYYLSPARAMLLELLDFSVPTLPIMSDSRYSVLDVEESKRSFETTSSDIFLQSPRKPLLTIGVLTSQDRHGIN
jgi:hypothetical protein